MTKVLHGSVRVIEELVREMGAEKVLLVTGLDARVGLDIPVDCHFQVAPNPPASLVKRGKIETHYDAVVGVGGGSAMDVAKLLHRDTNVPLIVAPTTAGSGAEMTPFATVYRDGVKESVACEEADYAVLDPELTMTMPQEVAAASGLDALCQGIESLWSIQSTAESRCYSRECIGLCVENLIMSVRRPDTDFRRAMMHAANLSGRAIAIAGTTLAHGMSYQWTAEHGIPHGLAVAWYLDGVLNWNMQVKETDCADPRGVQWVQERCTEVCSMLGAPLDFHAREDHPPIWNICDRLGVLAADFPAGCREYSDADPARAANNPRRPPCKTP